MSIHHHARRVHGTVATEDPIAHGAVQSIGRGGERPDVDLVVDKLGELRGRGMLSTAAYERERVRLAG